MTIKRIALAGLVAAGLILPALGGLGASPADAGINRVGADYSGGSEASAINRFGAD